MESFNEEFCEKLNGYLLEAMRYCGNPLARSCSMDGVLMPFVEKQLSKKHVNDTRKIETHAWALAPNGGIKFNLTVYLGKYSLRRYARSLALDDCLPAFDHPAAVKFDFEKEQIEVRLL